MTSALRTPTRILRATAAATGGAALTIAMATAAAAHVTVTPREAPADSYAVLTFGVPHGCGGSPTTEVAIQIPEEIASVTPTVNPNWTIDKVMVDLDEPITDSHGNEITERVGQVVYTALTPLPDHLRDAFELSVRLPDLPGETLAFPAVQTCEEGEHAWVQLAADGESSHDLDSPAPLLTLTGAAGHGDDVEDDGEAAGSGNEPEAAQDDDTTPVAAASSDASNAWGVAGLAAGLLGAVLGAIALARTRRQA